MRSASGFECPGCKKRDLAYIESADVVHILALRCAKCGKQWAVENAHPARPDGFMDKEGRGPS